MWTTHRWLYAGIFVLMCFASTVFADTVTVTLTSPPPGPYRDGIYVSPYTANINGIPTVVICDDFFDDTAAGQTWQATVNTFSTLGNALFSSNPQGYNQAAWLTLQLLTRTPGSAEQAYYSYAIWAVFAPGQVTAWLNSYHDTAAYNAIFGTNGIVASVPTSFQPGQFSNFEIYTPYNAHGATCSSAGNCLAQEFLAVQVPEGGSEIVYLLLSALVLGAIFLRLHFKEIGGRIRER
jgi:hypothetical protein